MTSKLFSALIASGVVFCSALCFGELTPPAIAPGASADRPAAGTSPAPERGAAPAPTKLEPGVERPLFVTIPPLFESLKRAPVMFWHDKHTAALKEEGCEACHPKKAGRFEFSFPKTRDESSRDALMASFHDACIGCHTQRSDEHKKAGPVTCGECHADKKAYHQEKYLPALPPHYEALRDPYHKDCVGCHLKPAKSAKDARELNWKTFYVQARSRIELQWPAIVYDYAIHDKHVRALERKCELCHYLAPALKHQLAVEGQEPTSQDWLREEEKGQSLKQRESAHRRCLNCHLERDAAKKPHGPVDCKDCHVDRLRTAKELENIPPLDYDKKELILIQDFLLLHSVLYILLDYDKNERILIQAEKAALAAVPFNHKSHIAASRSCGDCHHDTLESCKKCHTLQGTKEGKFITLADAYHKPGSAWSCIGCHDREKAKPDCAGCHTLRKDGLAAESCDACHTGKLESLDQAVKLPDPATLFTTNLTDELQISILAKEYEPSKVKHKDIAKKLTDISNNSKLATFFHKKETTICAGCHHLGAVEKNKSVPACNACHTQQNAPSGGTPTLLGAYHQQCLGCHQKMRHPEEKMPQACAGCHKEKKKQP